MLAARIYADLTEGMHPADWLDPSLPPRRGARGCHQGWRLLPPHLARRAAAPRGRRRGLRSDRRRHPGPQRGRDGGSRDHRPARGCRGPSRPDRARPPRPEPGRRAPRRDRSPRRDARVRHDRPDEVPPRQHRPGPHRGRRGRRAPGPHHPRPRPRPARLPPGVRRRTRAAVPDDGVRAAADAAAGRATPRGGSWRRTRPACSRSGRDPPGERGVRCRRDRGRLRGRLRGDHGSAAGLPDAPRGPPGVHGRHVDGRPGHLLRVLHARARTRVGSSAGWRGRSCSG